MTLIEQVRQAADLAQKRGLKKICRYCMKTNNEKSEMVCEPENLWHKCPKCGEVQPVDTSIPLHWSFCSNVIDNKFCLYPSLVTPEQDGTKTTCKKCNNDYDIALK